jgi:hypothetical protein
MGLYVLSVVDLHVRPVDVASPMRCDGMMYVLRRGGVSGHKIRNSETRCEKAHSLIQSFLHPKARPLPITAYLFPLSEGNPYLIGASVM